ncbi:hypothetical protein HELRODRAFT_182281 [Helobdella robusta]|uniref:Endonuclease/exonuclease/phosphatase domain-containing protein n=1 Tax=Helobdella robusta TaxID=6412 RepID=T1FI09_HELRO|nr:hypothetical protein HELRODRAFT_182281 [Helobdella robusta]ESN91051.1 hypothetical protein HELRODRAFT_182281 [Helobdella robusta]
MEHTKGMTLETAQFGQEYVLKNYLIHQKLQQTLPTWMFTGFLSTERAIPAILICCLLLRAGIEPNPAPHESKLSKSSKMPIFRVHAIYRKDRGNSRRGGLITLIHNSIPFSIMSLPDTPTIESQDIKINAGGTDINIVDIYIPPQSVCTTGFSASILQFLSISNVVLLGNVNAHNSLRYSSLEDTRGEALASEIENSGCDTLNLDTPTRLPTFGQPSSPDISVASDTLIINMECEEPMIYQLQPQMTALYKTILSKLVKTELYEEKVLDEGKMLVFVPVCTLNIKEMLGIPSLGC